MRRKFNTIAAIGASIINIKNQKKALKDIEKTNANNRHLLSLGNVTKDVIIPSYEQIGNICISGGSAAVRNDLLIQNVVQARSVGMATIVLHEGNHNLEQQLANTCAGFNYFRIINSKNPFYEPIYQLSADEAASLIVKSSSEENKIEATGLLYLRAVNRLLLKKGIVPYTRMLAICPHNSIQNVVLEAETNALITPDEAQSLRDDITAGLVERPNIEYFFTQLQAEAESLAWKSNLSKSTSIFECVKNSGVMSFDIGSTNKATQLSLIISEIKNCISKGYSFRLILDTSTIYNNDKRLVDLLKSNSNMLAWTLSSSDIGMMLGGRTNELSSWMVLSNKTIIFSHGAQSAEALSKELGEYDAIEITHNQAGSNGFSEFGYHFSNNNNIATSIKRERIIKPEELIKLAKNEFIITDNYTGEISKGVLVL